MKRVIFVFIFLFIGLFLQEISAKKLDYTLIKKGVEDNNTLLLIGGIQGDEPGGFLAASIVATDYNITKGSLWVVPNLNFPSIIQRSRGTKGDMNRKFAHIDLDDPDYKAVVGIKEAIKDPKISLILNLHDGSGFYRDEYINSDLNPNKWGSTCIIDQANLENSIYPDLNAIAQKVKDSINKNILDKKHIYSVKNTKTAKGDKEMLKTLTYFAVTQNKSAFANEASKNLNAQERVYYHLLAIEEYMKIMGIEFQRPFNLDVKSVKRAIEKEIKLSFYGDMFVLNFLDARNLLHYIPLAKYKDINYSSSSPLVAVLKDGSSYVVQYGNRFITRLIPQYFEHGNKIGNIKLIVDGKELNIKSGEKVLVKKTIKVISQNHIRANFIGFSSGSSDESDVNVDVDKMIKRYSIDKSGKMYRVEFYDTQTKEFVGMFLAEFT